MNKGADLEALSHTHDDSVEATPVSPLRKRQADGRLYSRPHEIENGITSLSQLTKDEFVARVVLDDSSPTPEVLSECLMYFVRRPPFGNDEGVLHALFTAIRQRVLRAVPVRERRIAGTGQKGEPSVVLQTRDLVLDRFHAMLCQDRSEYQERLDFFECRFNLAVARLRMTARRDIRKDAAHFEPLVHDSETNDPSPGVVAAISCFTDSFDGPKTDFLYRSKIHDAISSLPPDERRVIELFLKDIPIDSMERNTMTMVKMLGCSEKTVRNRRDRAFAKLAGLLKEESAS